MPEKERPDRPISEIYTTGEQHLLRPKSRPERADVSERIDLAPELDQKDDGILGVVARDGRPSDIEQDDGASTPPEPIDPSLRHAFALVGTKTFFAVHIVNWWTEGHNVELILRLDIEGERDELRKWQRQGKPIYLVNDAPITIADQVGTWRMGNGFANTFDATVWNVGPPSGDGWKSCESKDHGGCVPWDDADAALSGIPVKVTDVVRYRHANLNLRSRRYEDYFLFGDSGSGEYHMQHSPTIEPDYDHIASLKRTSDETDLLGMLSAGELATGVMVSVPSICWHSDCTYTDPPFAEGDQVPVLYHGITKYRTLEGDVPLPDYTVTIGSQAWFNASAMNWPGDPVPTCGDAG